jgi:hypothetical protein
MPLSLSDDPSHQIRSSAAPSAEFASRKVRELLTAAPRKSFARSARWRSSPSMAVALLPPSDKPRRVIWRLAARDAPVAASVFLPSYELFR